MEKKEKLIIINHSATQSEDSFDVQGTAKNVSNSTIKFAKIRIVFLGDQGSVIGGTADNVWNLASGETWNFRGGT